MKGTAKMVTTLLNSGANLSAITKTGYTALDLANEAGNTDAAQVLRNVELINEAKKMNGDADIDKARKLIMGGADVNSADKYGKTALDYAKEMNKVDLIKELKNAALRKAAENGHTHNVKLLINDEYANVNAVSISSYKNCSSKKV